MKKLLSIISLVIFGLISCSKDEDNKPSSSLASVTTTTATAINSAGATTGGNVVSDGGDLVTARGVVYATSQNPTLSNSLTTAGTGLGAYSSILTGLTPQTTYYVRAYATNGAGTSYGNQISFTTTTATLPAIGQPYLGGILAYVLLSGDPGYNASIPHGYIAAPSDQSTGSEWGCYGTLITGNMGSVLGTGNQNTTNIITVCTSPGIAAKLCADLTLNGYSDWYLPSLHELNRLYMNRVAIGGFSNAYYWSSTQHVGNPTDDAWWIDFTDGTMTYNGKYVLCHVRAIRSF